jgi:hypothetical protein
MITVQAHAESLELIRRAHLRAGLPCKLIVQTVQNFEMLGVRPLPATYRGAVTCSHA